VLLSELGFALRLGIWLCWLPILLRLRPLPELLGRHRLAPRQVKRRSPLEIERTVRIVLRLCGLQVFSLPLFPRSCLRQSMALHRVLTHMGYPVEIHFGIRKEGEVLKGHSWVTLHGKLIADGTQTKAFRLVYSHTHNHMDLEK
jgi:Transglutaminase-like superfamily